MLLIFDLWGRLRSTVCGDGPRHEATGGQMVLWGRLAGAAARAVELRMSEVRVLSGLIGPGSRRSFLLRLRTSVVLFGNVEVVRRRSSPGREVSR